MSMVMAMPVANEQTPPLQSSSKQIHRLRLARLHSRGKTMLLLLNKAMHSRPTFGLLLILHVPMIDPNRPIPLPMATVALMMAQQRQEAVVSTDRPMTRLKMTLSPPWPVCPFRSSPAAILHRSSSSSNNNQVYKQLLRRILIEESHRRLPLSHPAGRAPSLDLPDSPRGA